MSVPLSARKLALPSPPPTPRSQDQEGKEFQKEKLTTLMEMGKAMDEIVSKALLTPQLPSASTEEPSSQEVDEGEDEKILPLKAKPDRRTLRMYCKIGDVVHKRGILFDFSEDIATHDFAVQVHYMAKGTITHIAMEKELIPFDGETGFAKLSSHYRDGPNLFVESLVKKGNRVTMKGVVIVL
jgi:hypothetical protein